MRSSCVDLLSVSVAHTSPAGLPHIMCPFLNNSHCKLLWGVYQLNKTLCSKYDQPPQEVSWHTIRNVFHYCMETGRLLKGCQLKYRMKSNHDRHQQLCNAGRRPSWHRLVFKEHIASLQITYRKAKTRFNFCFTQILSCCQGCLCLYISCKNALCCSRCLLNTSTDINEIQKKSLGETKMSKKMQVNPPWPDEVSHRESSHWSRYFT